MVIPPSLDDETWCKIEESPHLWISNLGRMWREPFLQWSKSKAGNPYQIPIPARLIETFHISTKGYCRINAMGTVHFVHRLVAKYHVPNPQNLPQVNHIDGIKSNNNSNNLEWTTNQENRDHAVKMGLQATRATGLGKLTPKQVEDVKYRFNNGEMRAHLAREFKVSHLTITRIIFGRRARKR